MTYGLAVVKGPWASPAPDCATASVPGLPGASETVSGVPSPSTSTCTDGVPTLTEAGSQRRTAVDGVTAGVGDVLRTFGGAVGTRTVADRVGRGVAVGDAVTTGWRAARHDTDPGAGQPLRRAGRAQQVAAPSGTSTATTSTAAAARNHAGTPAPADPPAPPRLLGPAPGEHLAQGAGLRSGRRRARRRAARAASRTPNGPPRRRGRRASSSALLDPRARRARPAPRSRPAGQPGRATRTPSPSPAQAERVGRLPLGQVEVVPHQDDLALTPRQLAQRAHQRPAGGPASAMSSALAVSGSGSGRCFAATRWRRIRERAPLTTLRCR